MIRSHDLITREADAATILSQIGRWTLAEIGARDFVSMTDGIMFKVSPSKKVIVKLAWDDTYTVETVSINRRDFTFSSKYFVEGVYAEQMSEVVKMAAVR